MDDVEDTQEEERPPAPELDQILERYGADHYEDRDFLKLSSLAINHKASLLAVYIGDVFHSFLDGMDGFELNSIEYFIYEYFSHNSKPLIHGNWYFLFSQYFAVSKKTCLSSN